MQRRGVRSRELATIRGERGVAPELLFKISI